MYLSIYYPISTIIHHPHHTHPQKNDFKFQNPKLDLFLLYFAKTKYGKLEENGELPLSSNWDKF